MKHTKSQWQRAQDAARRRDLKKATEGKYLDNLHQKKVNDVPQRTETPKTESE
jgi:hypothetical protein